MPPDAESVAPRLPEVLSDEDGDAYFATGHVDPLAFAFAVVLDVAENVADEDAIDLIGPRIRGWRRDLRRQADAFIEKVEYVWMAEDPDNEEMMHRCSEGDLGAMPFTLVNL